MADNNTLKQFLDRVPADVATTICVERATEELVKTLEKIKSWHTSEQTTDDLMGKLLTAVEAGEMSNVIAYAAIISTRNELYGDK